MDNDFWVDAQEIHRIIDESDVVIVRFTTVSLRMMIDTRCAPHDPPVVRLVPRAGSSEERFRELRNARPGLPVPNEIMSFLWPRPVSSFARSGTLERILLRFSVLGYPETEAPVRRTFQDLVQRERRELYQAVKGEGYQSLWERRPS